MRDPSSILAGRTAVFVLASTTTSNRIDAPAPSNLPSVPTRPISTSGLGSVRGTTSVRSCPLERGQERPGLDTNDGFRVVENV